MSLAGRQIGFIGGGAMAEALAGGLVAGGVSAAQIQIAEPLPERCAQLRDRLGVTVRVLVLGDTLSLLAHARATVSARVT